MSAITVFVIIIGLAAFGVMVAGGLSMARGGSFDELHSAQLMEARVIVQAIAVGLIAVALLFWV